jgi:hypothetical protein
VIERYKARTIGGKSKEIFSLGKSWHAGVNRSNGVLLADRATNDNQDARRMEESWEIDDFG